MFSLYWIELAAHCIIQFSEATYRSFSTANWRAGHAVLLCLMRGSTVWHCLLVDFPKNTNNTTSKSQLIKLFKMLRGYMQYDTQQGKKKTKKTTFIQRPYANLSVSIIVILKQIMKKKGFPHLFIWTFRVLNFQILCPYFHDSINLIYSFQSYCSLCTKYWVWIPTLVVWHNTGIPLEFVQDYPALGEICTFQHKFFFF